MKRRTVEANDFLLDSFRLAAAIYEDGFQPDFLLGVWRGGCPVGVFVQEGLQYLGLSTDHNVIQSSYSGRPDYPFTTESELQVPVEGFSYLVEHLKAEHSLLIVDDVYSSGSSMAAIIGELKRAQKENFPKDVRVASVWYRPDEIRNSPPDYYIHKTKDWLIMPYELMGLSVDEICERKLGLAKVFTKLRNLRMKGSSN